MPDQLDWHDVNHIRKPHWEFAFPTQATAPVYLTGLFARPFLRRYFPNIDIYIWIDADAWIQDCIAIDLFREGAIRKRGMALVPQLHRASLQQYGGLPEFHKWLHHHFQVLFGSEIRSDSFSRSSPGRQPTSRRGCRSNRTGKQSSYQLSPSCRDGWLPGADCGCRNRSSSAETRRCSPSGRCSPWRRNDSSRCRPMSSGWRDRWCNQQWCGSSSILQYFFW